MTRRPYDMVRVLNPSPELIAAITAGEVQGEVYSDGEVYVTLVSLERLEAPWAREVRHG